MGEYIKTLIGSIALLLGSLLVLGYQSILPVLEKEVFKKDGKWIGLFDDGCAFNKDQIICLDYMNNFATTMVNIGSIPWSIVIR